MILPPTTSMQLISDVATLPRATSVPVSPLPLLSPETSGNISYIGFTFAHHESVESKLYYMPNRCGVAALAPHLCAEHLACLKAIDARNQALGCRLYDCSCRCSDNVPMRYRLVWKVPYAARRTAERLKLFLHDFLRVNHIAMPTSDAERMNECLEELCPSVISPLFLIGGEINEFGLFNGLKLDWDADIVEHADLQRAATLYDDASALEISLRIIEPFMAHSELPAYREFFRTLLREGYFLHSWGMNVSPHGTDDVKVYFKAKNAKKIAAESFVHDFFRARNLRDAETFSSLVRHFLNRSWSYVGFCLSFNREGLQALKTYVMSPYCES